MTFLNTKDIFHSNGGLSRISGFGDGLETARPSQARTTGAYQGKGPVQTILSSTA